MLFRSRALFFSVPIIGYTECASPFSSPFVPECTRVPTTTVRRICNEIINVCRWINRFTWGKECDVSVCFQRIFVRSHTEVLRARNFIIFEQITFLLIPRNFISFTSTCKFVSTVLICIIFISFCLKFSIEHLVPPEHLKYFYTSY